MDSALMRSTCSTILVDSSGRTLQPASAATWRIKSSGSLLTLAYAMVSLSSNSSRCVFFGCSISRAVFPEGMYLKRALRNSDAALFTSAGPFSGPLLDPGGTAGVAVHPGRGPVRSA